MTEAQRLGVLALVIDLLNKAGSWTGRMHIQKFIYFAQNLLGLPTGYDFVLYQRGPYTFELDDDIRALRSIGAVDIRPAPPYGPSYVSTHLGDSIMKLAPITQPMRDQLKLLSEALGKPKQARDLELLATTFYVVQEGIWGSDEEIVERVVGLKPQFKKDEAAGGLREVREIAGRFGASE